SLVACGRTDQARQVFSNYLKHIEPQMSQWSEESRLNMIETLIGVATRLGDNAVITKFADELSRVELNEPNAPAVNLLSRVVMQVWNADPARGRALLAKTLEGASILDDDARNDVTMALAGAVIRTGAVRKARLTSLQVTNTDSSLSALLDIVEHEDKT